MNLADAIDLNIGTVGSTSGVAASGALTLNVSGNVAATEAVNVGTFTLVNGDWSQLSGSLPGFSAQNFVISGGSFLRAAAGDGSSGNPYQIADVYGLQGIGSTRRYSRRITRSPTASTPAARQPGTAAPASRRSAATTPDSFTGTLNGNGNTISDLTINASSSLTVGLFGAVGTGGLVENVGLTGGSVSGGFTMGELIGLNSGTVTNSYATGTVNGSVSAESIGGLIGTNKGTLTGAYATGAVNGSGFAVRGRARGIKFRHDQPVPRDGQRNDRRQWDRRRPDRP